MNTYDDNLLASRFAALAPEPLTGDWADVLRRSGVAQQKPSRLGRFGALRSRRRVAMVLVAAAVVVVAAASAFATVSELFFDPSKPRKESRTVDGVEFTFNVPGSTGTGWQNHNDPEDDVFISKSFDVIGQHASAVIYWTAFPDGGIATPCRNLLRQGFGGSTYALAAAMARAPGVSVVQRPLRTTVGGRSATHVVLKVRKDRGCDPGYFFTWWPKSVAETGGSFWIGTGVGDTIRVWVISVGGKRLVVAAETERPRPELHPHARAEWTNAEREIASIVRSIRFR